MPIIGVLHLELRIEHAESLKDRRNVIRSLKARLRSRHNVAVAEIGPSDFLNRALVSAVDVRGEGFAGGGGGRGERFGRDAGIVGD